MDNEKKIRRSQLIFPFGIGSIVPFGLDFSLIVAGIDDWATDEQNEIVDERLCRRLHVSKLFLPPDFDATGNGRKNSIPSFRFPCLYYCSNCGYVDLIDRSETASPIFCHVCSGEGSKGAAKMIPERFVLICEHGHISDFPVAEFLKSKGQDIDPKKWNEHTMDGRKYRFSHQIFRHTNKKSSSLGDISFSLGNGPHSPHFSLAGITVKGAMKNILTTCPGERPWLDQSHDKCDVPGSELLVVQRGGSNVWFPQIATSIYLPSSENGQFSSDLIAAVKKNAEKLKTVYLASGAINESIASFLGFSQTDLENCFEKIILKKAGSVQNAKDQTETEYRFEEFEKLISNYGSDSEDIYVKSLPIAKYSSSLWPFFESVSLVEKLKETTAFYGFSRLAPRNDPVDTFKTTLSNVPKNWLPAIQNSGEGIFVKFLSSNVEAWAKNPAIIKRAERVEKYRQKSLFYNPGEDFCVTPEFLLIHTFSHLLINQLSKSCGYGSSSLKERLYVSTEEGKKMYGVLIYTSSSSSEGSLGGLVKQGKPGRLEEIINAAIEEARWCSSDPVCIESKGQGPDSCNLAACFNCALLPETCCEKGNKYLDRVCLIGSLDNQEIGYFNRIPQ